jgi:hypothetical protein
VLFADWDNVTTGAMCGLGLCNHRCYVRTVIMLQRVLCADLDNVTTDVMCGLGLSEHRCYVHYVRTGIMLPHVWPGIM